MKRFLWFNASLFALLIMTKLVTSVGSIVTPEVTTNMTASVTATAISSDTIWLNLTAQSWDGRAIVGWHIYRDGLWIQDVINPDFRPEPPGDITVTPP